MQCGLLRVSGGLALCSLILSVFCCFGHFLGPCVCLLDFDRLGHLSAAAVGRGTQRLYTYLRYTYGSRRAKKKLVYKAVHWLVSLKYDLTFALHPASYIDIPLTTLADFLPLSLPLVVSAQPHNSSNLHDPVLPKSHLSTQKFV